MKATKRPATKTLARASRAAPDLLSTPPAGGLVGGSEKTSQFHYTKLELGSGDRPFSTSPEWEHLDLRRLPHVEIVADARRIPRPDNQYEEVYSHWLLEHFARLEVIAVLQEWARVLRPGGTLTVITSNGEALNRAVLAGEISWSEWNYITFADEDQHRMSFSPEYALQLCREAGLDARIESVQTACRRPDGALSCPGLTIVAIKP